MFVREDVLMLMLLRFPQEIRASAKLDLPSSADKDWQPANRELDLPLRLIDEMAIPWDPAEYKDEYQESLMDYIDRKIATGGSVDDVKNPSADRDDSKSDKVLDLAEYLERSIKKPAPSEPKSVPSGKPKPPAKRGSVKNDGKKVPAKKASRSA